MNLITEEKHSFAKNISTGFPLLFAIVFYLAITSIYLGYLISKTGSHFVYPLDDSYISMAVGRNLIDYGVWGVDRYEFASLTSTLLWPLLLAAGDVFSRFREFCPLVWNIIFSLITLIYVNQILIKTKLNTLLRTIGLLSFVLLIPLPVMTCLGMETTMQICFTLIFIDLATRAVLLDKPVCNWQLCAAAILLGSSRYEGLFTIGIVFLLFARKKQYLQGLFLLVCGCLPIVIYGMYSVAHGSYFLPNTVLFKAHLNSFLPFNPSKGYFPEGMLNWFDMLGVQVFYEPVGVGLLLLSTSMTLLTAPLAKLQKKAANICLMLAIADAVFAAVFLSLKQSLPSATGYNILFGGMRFTAAITLLNGFILSWSLYTSQSWTTARVWLTIFGLNFLLHMTLGRVGWGYRYEAYLVAQGILVALLSWQELNESSKSKNSKVENKKESVKLLNTACIIGLILIEFSSRAIMAFPFCTDLAVSVYRQQCQMANFIKSYFPNSTILIGDIGAIAFYNDHIKIIDLVGLASIEVIKARIHNEFNSEFANQLANKNHCDLIVIYDNLLTNGFGGIPEEWIKIATWTDKGNKGAGETVSFYALKQEKADYAVQCLRQFKLPSPVKQIIFQP